MISTQFIYRTKRLSREYAFQIEYEADNGDVYVIDVYAGDGNGRQEIWELLADDVQDAIYEAAFADYMSVCQTAAEDRR